MNKCNKTWGVCILINCIMFLNLHSTHFWPQTFAFEWRLDFFFPVAVFLQLQYITTSKWLPQRPHHSLLSSPLPAITQWEFLLSWLQVSLCALSIFPLACLTLEGVWFSQLQSEKTQAPRGGHICRGHTSQNIVFQKPLPIQAHTFCTNTSALAVIPHQ